MIVFWIAITVVFLWLIAKALGFIHTPAIITIIPYVGGFIAMLAVAKEVGKFMEKLARALVDINEMKHEMNSMHGEINQIRSSTASLDKRIAVIEARTA